MSTIQAAMLVLLGVLLATLAVLLILPYYGRRAARLATDALRRSMPLTEAEIRADKDRLRAEHAVTIHKLEKKIDDASLSAARQMVEINRRDAAISALESELAGTKTLIEEAENARRVLELTITDRLPRVEQRFADAKKLLMQRDREIATLTETAGKQAQALDEARAINAQQRDEVHRVNATLAARAARSRDALAPDARFDEEVAIRSELEALRAKTRDQTALIKRLQELTAKGVAAGDLIGAGSGISNEGTGSAASASSDAARLAHDLAEAEIALRAARNPSESGHNAIAAREAELRTLKAQKQDADAEIARLKSALRSYEGEDSSDGSAIKDSKLALKAKLTSIQAQAEQQQATIHSLRADLAAANERLARQATHFMDEMRRLGGGTTQTSGGPRREVTAPPPERKRSLAERIAAPRPQPPRPAAESAPVNGTAASAGAPAAGATGDHSGDHGEDAAQRSEREAERVSGFLRALDTAPDRSAASPAASPSEPRGSGLKVSAIIASDASGAEREASAALGSMGSNDALPAASDEPGVPAPAAVAAAAPPAPAAVTASNGDAAAPKPARRPGLLERLTGIDKSASSAE